MDLSALKQVAAVRAVAEVESGMVLGLGTGSTATLAVAELGRRQREEGLKIIGIPTSERTAAQARELEIPLSDFATHQSLDLTIDGADAVERGTLSMIKGLGGALLREKIVAAASDRMTAIVDDTKLRGPIGSFCPVPIEVTPFGWQVTRRHIEALGAEAVLRPGTGDQPYVTDGGNFILDGQFGAIADAAALDEAIRRIVGVIETGLFIGIATQVIVAGAGGIEILARG